MSRFGIGDLLDVAKMNVNKEGRAIAIHGLIWPGTYDPANGTVSALVLSTAASAQPMTLTGCNLLTPYVGQQSPPQGGERCLLIPTEDGSYGVLVYVFNDDTPQAPAGEWWAQRFSTNTPPTQQKQFVRIQNDGATRIGGASKVAVISPVTNLGAENLPSGKGVVTKDDLQAALNAQQQAFQQALNSLAQIVQGGQGVPAPQLSQVQAQGSTTVFASE